MASLYTQQSSNVRKTWFLMTVFLTLIVGVGWLVSRYFDNPLILLGALVFSFGMNFVAYWFSDSIALSSAGAVEADVVAYRELHRLVENLAITAGLPKPRVYIIEDPAPNAFATGRDPEHSAIAVTTGLIERLERNELEGVIAHELAHVGNRDILVMTVAVVLAGFLAALADFALRASALGGSSREKANPIVIVGVFIAIILAPIAAQLIQLAISRKREFLADATGALLTRYPEGLASALQKISSYDAPVARATHATAHLYIANPFGGHEMSEFIGRLFATHPPIPERIKALRSMHV